MNRLLILICLSLMLIACHHDVVSSAHQDLSEQGWAMTDTVRLSLDVPDTTQAYDIALMLRHTEQYNYQNLWFFIQCGDSLSPIQSDTVMACLADDRGQWLGTRAGRYYSGYVIMERELVFPEAGAYTFAIVHGMRDSLIHGIADVGLELRKHDYGKEYSPVLAMKGEWRNQFFHNDHPLLLELGCGHGDYTVGLARVYPNTNYIGVDIKGARMWQGAKQATRDGLTNVAFLRTNIEMLPNFFATDEVDGLWITFPDPQMKKATKRLQTHYEHQWLERGLTIKYLAWQLPKSGTLVEPEIEIEKDTYRSYGRNYVPQANN